MALALQTRALRVAFVTTLLARRDVVRRRDEARSVLHTAAAAMAAQRMLPLAVEERAAAAGASESGRAARAHDDMGVGALEAVKAALQRQARQRQGAVRSRVGAKRPPADHACAAAGAAAAGP